MLDSKYQEEGLAIEEIKRRNFLEYKKKGYIEDLLFFKDFMLATDDEKRKMIKTIDLEAFLQLRKWRQENHKLPLLSTFDGHWLPQWLKDVDQFVGGNGLGMKYKSTLGIELLRLNLMKEFKTLSKFDKKAKERKKRTKLPRGLIGKQLKFIRLSKDKYLIKVLKKKQFTSNYHKKLKLLDERGLLDLGNSFLKEQVEKFERSLK